MQQSDKLSNNGNNKPSNLPSNAPQLSEETIRDFILYQSQEYELKKQEAALRDKELDRAHTISLRSLTIQQELLSKAPDHAFKHKCLFLGFILLLFIIIASVFVYCVYSGNKDVAMRIVESVVLLIGGGGGGYAIGRSRKDKPNVETAEVVE